MTARNDPTERDLAPIDRAVGRYKCLCDEYAHYVRRGDGKKAARLLAQIEPARVKMIEVCERFNAKWGRA